MAESGPPPLNPKGVRRRWYAAAYSVSGLSGSMAMSLTPVSSLIFRTCDQLLPPSLVLYTPRSGFGPHKCPSAATYTTSEFFAWTTIRPMCRVASSPIFFHVFPPSSDLYTPLPHDELCRLFGSPVPTHTMDGSDGAIAMSPIVAGPISRNSKFFSLSTGLAWSVGTARVFVANAPIQAAIARNRRRAYEPCFISFPHAQGRAFYSCWPVPRIICFWKGRPSPCKVRRATLVSRFSVGPRLQFPS